MTQKPYWTQYKNPPKICQNADCDTSVSLAVPISPNRLRDYIWLCRACARHHNENWNYKQGKSNAEIESIIRDDMYWNRPTEPFAQSDKPFKTKALQDAIQGMMDMPTSSPQLYHLPRHIQDAYRELELKAPLDAEPLKKHYKILAKKYHPDARQDGVNDDKIKKINVAYDMITEYSKHIKFT